MASKKPTPDYLNLPFEIHYAHMNTVGYEPMHKPGKPPKKNKDYKVMEVKQGRVYDVTFRCDDPSSGELIFVMRGNLDEFIPDWLEMISDDDGLEIKWSRRSKFRIEKNVIQIDGDDDGDYEDYDYGEMGATYYQPEGFTPDYLIVDADGSRLKIDLEGYKLDAKNNRVGKAPVVTYTDDQADEMDVDSRDEYDISYEVAGWFK